MTYEVLKLSTFLTTSFYNIPLMIFSQNSLWSLSKLMISNISRVLTLAIRLSISKSYFNTISLVCLNSLKTFRKWVRLIVALKTKNCLKLGWSLHRSKNVFTGILNTLIWLVSKNLFLRFLLFFPASSYNVESRSNRI